MNNHRLLTGLIASILLSGGVHAYSQSRRLITINELFEIAESNSMQLRPSMTAEQEARQQIRIARSEWLPDINANLTLSYKGNGFTTNRSFADYQKASIPHFGNGLNINITQPVFTGGAISNSIEMAELKSTASRYVTEMQRDNIRFQLVGYYLDIYKCENLRKVLRNNIEQAQKLLSEMKARYEQGVALQNDITRYELLVSNLQLQLTKINNTLKILNNNLVVIAGLPAETEIVPDTTILSQSLPAHGENVWQTEASENAPSLKLARSNIEISRKAEALTKSDRMPKIGVQAAWSLEGPILVEVPPINRNLSYWWVGLGVSYDVSSLYKSNKTLTARRLGVQKSLEELDAAAENVSIAINADYVRYLESYEELKTQQKSVELADRNYQTISTRYSADMALITDLLDAANSKLESEQQLVNARINIIYYYYKLLFTSGKI